MLTGGLRSAPAAVPHASRAAVSMALENMFGEMISITPGMKTYMMGVDIKQDKYKTAVANAAGTVADNVEIVAITEARRRAGKVDVETKVRTNQRTSRPALRARHIPAQCACADLRSCPANDPAHVQQITHMRCKSLADPRG